MGGKLTDHLALVAKATVRVQEGDVPPHAERSQKYPKILDLVFAKDNYYAPISTSTLGSAFPNLAPLFLFCMHAGGYSNSRERSFSNMKLLLRSQLGDDTLAQAMRVSRKTGRYNRPLERIF